MLTFQLDLTLIEIPVREIWKPIHKSTPGWSRSISIEGNHPLRQNLILKRPGLDYSHSGLISLFTKEKYENQAVVIGNGLTITYRKPESEPFLAPKPKPIVINEATPITSAPGFDGVRLPLRGDIMPTGINWDQQGRLIYTSLKGDLFRATDSDKDGLFDQIAALEWVYGDRE